MKSSETSKRIRKIMKEKKLTQQNLSQLLQISQPSISQYLQGRIPPANVLHEIAKIGNTTMEWLVSGKNPPEAGQVQETPAVYGPHHEVLEVWEKLPDNIQKSMLKLMNEIGGTTSVAKPAKTGRKRGRPKKQK
ncbi:MAG: helix-turn-helix transcriptional regulator [Calditrichia bacterium]